MGRRALLLLLLLAALGASCGRAPKVAKLVVCVEEEPASLDPRLGADVAADRVFRLLYRGLFTVGEDQRPVADLVESWAQEDPTHYRFVLKRGVRFSDGREVRAADAAFTLRSILDPSLPSFRKGDLDRVASVEADGPYDLRLVLREPFAPILSCLTVGILPEGTPPNASPPVGCGPYRLKRWERGQWLVFEANPYAEAPPASTTLALKIVPDPVVRALEMRRGSVDLEVNDLPPDSLAYFQAHGYQVLRRPGSSYAYLGLNLSRPPLDRQGVRQALALAIDREAVIQNILRGFARPASGLLPPEHWAYEGSVPRFPHDPRQAAALLDREGLAPGPGGVRFALTYKTSQNKVSQQIATAFAQDLAAVGVLVRIQSLEWGTFYGDVQRGDFDLFALTWVGVTDPDGFRLRFDSAAVPPEGFNRGRYANAEVDRLVREGALAFDVARRRALYARVQQILAGDLPYLSLWWPDAVCVAKPGVTGIRLPPDGNFSFLSGVTAGR